MSEVNISLKPYWEQDRVEKLEVAMSVSGMSFKADETVCTMQLKTVSIPGCVPENVAIADKRGAVETHIADEAAYPCEFRHWKSDRATEGAVTISYTVKPRVLEPDAICGPYFDFRTEEGGASSAGISILMDISEAEKTQLEWDLSAMPKGSRGVCIFGEGKILAGSLETLRQSYFAMGGLSSIEDGDFGFYWLSQPQFDVRAVAEFTKELFAHMQGFFKDTEKIYRIFVRKDPFKTSGGTAMYRSYMFGWNETQPCSLEDRKTLLAHEMVHNWPSLNDNPYGVTTWYAEGTAEYYSVMLPLRLGLMSDDEALAELQKRTDNYYSNPTRGLGDEEAAAICWKDRRAQRLAYGRGMIFLINTDIQMRGATGGKACIDDAVLDILRQQREGVTLGNEVFLEAVRKFSGLDVHDEWAKMHSGGEIKPLSGGFEGRFAVEEKEIAEADTGKTVRSWRWKKV